MFIIYTSFNKFIGRQKAVCFMKSKKMVFDITSKEEVDYKKELETKSENQRELILNDETKVC